MEDRVWKVRTARLLLPGNSALCYRTTHVPEFCPKGGPHPMMASMYKVSVPIFVQFLTAQSECIDKAGAHIEAKQLDPNFFLNMRLFPDMYPYARQVQQASTHAARCCSALAGTEMPNMPNTEASFAELKARLAKTIDYCKTFTPAQIDSTADKELTTK